MSKVWFITGASRGLGREIALAALAAGHKVVGTARRSEDVADALSSAGGEMLPLVLDVTRPGDAEAAVQAAVDAFGRIDVLVNNAGVGQFGWFETISDAQMRRQMEVNFFGALAVARAVLPVMRAQRLGHVFTISSVSGMVSVAGTTAYSGSKFALEGWAEGLAEEVRPLGIRATIVQPGMMRTDFLEPDAASYGDIDIPDYSEAAAALKTWLGSMSRAQAGDAARLGASVVAMADMLEPPARILLGSDAVELGLGKAERVVAEIDRWRALSMSTDRTA